jgi:hypothetical protein
MSNRTMVAPITKGRVQREQDYAVQLAAWLNELGPDDAPFGVQGPYFEGGRVVTNAIVRKRWIGYGNNVEVVKASK